MELNGCCVLALNVMGGLCSRLRAVIAAADWCQRNGVPQLIINWPKAEPNLKEFGGFTLRLQELWDVPDNWFAVEGSITKWPKEITTTDKDTIYIRTCHPEPFSPPSVSGLMAQLAKMVPKFDAKDYRQCIGVNVRWSLRESHGLTSTPEWYALRVNHVAELTGCRDVKVVCDSASAYKRFRAVLSPQLVVHENVRAFDYDANGIAWQAQEIYELASTRWFIGAEGSSYSQMVRWIRGDTALSLQDCDVRGGRGEDAKHLADDEFITEVFNAS